MDRQSPCHEIHLVLAVDQRERERHRQAESKRPPVLTEIPVSRGVDLGFRKINGTLREVSVAESVMIFFHVCHIVISLAIIVQYYMW